MQVQIEVDKNLKYRVYITRTGIDKEYKGEPVDTPQEAIALSNRVEEECDCGHHA